MDLQARLEAAVQHHNTLLNRESALEQERNMIHDQRIEALGRVKVLQELRSEEMSAEQATASENHHSDAPVPIVDQFERG